jgi:hypothetical protein
MTDTLCGVCRTPCEKYGYWCGEPLCQECHNQLVEDGYNPVVVQG